MGNATSSESGSEGQQRLVSDEKRSFFVNLGKLVPPKGKSANIKGEGFATFAGNTLSIDGVNENGTNVILYTVIATAVTYALLIPLMLVSVLAPEVLKVIAVLGAYAWYMIFRSTLKKGVLITIDSDTPKAYYMQKRGIACVELPDGRWVAFRCLDEETPMLLEYLREMYGERLALGQ